MKFLALHLFIVVVSAGLFVSGLPAQEFDRANTVVVTAPEPADASLTSPDIASARTRLGTLPAAVNVVGTDDLQRGRGSYLEDLLRYQPGVVIQSAQGSEDTKLSIRGSGVQNDDIIGVTVLVDGIPLNQADGEAFLHDVDLQSVQYAEVYRGADALRYGSVTLGGAVNLVTLTGRDADPFTARASFGSFGFYEQQLTSGWSKGPWDMYGSVVDHLLDGYRDHAQENYQKAFLSLGYRISDTAENRFYFFYGRLDQNNPSSLAEGRPVRQPAPDRGRGDHRTMGHPLGLRASHGPLRGQKRRLPTCSFALSWNHRQQTQRQEFEDDFRLGAVRYYSDDFGADIAFESTADLFGRKNRLSIGVVPDLRAGIGQFLRRSRRETRRELLFADRTYYLNLPVYLENQHYLTRQLVDPDGFSGRLREPSVP